MRPGQVGDVPGVHLLIAGKSAEQAERGRDPAGRGLQAIDFRHEFGGCGATVVTDFLAHVRRVAGTAGLDAGERALRLARLEAAIEQGRRLGGSGAGRRRAEDDGDEPLAAA